MPRLLFFTVCEKPIIDREDASLSLMTVLHGIKVPAPPEQPIPADALLPFKWGAAAQWRRLPEDEGKIYEQRVQIILPDGTGSGDSIISFIMSDVSHANAVRGTTFPVGIPGEHSVRLSFREAGDENEWLALMDWPIDIVHVSS